VNEEEEDSDSDEEDDDDDDEDDAGCRASRRRAPRPADADCPVVFTPAYAEPTMTTSNQVSRVRNCMLHAARADEYHDSRYRDVVRVIANGKRGEGEREREGEREGLGRHDGRPLRFSARRSACCRDMCSFSSLSVRSRIFIRGIQASAKRAGRSFLWRRAIRSA